jgi:hypothetical protein
MHRGSIKRCLRRRARLDLPSSLCINAWIDLTAIAQMTDSEAVMNLLRKVPLFANLKDEDKVCIEETEEWRLPAGEMLVEEAEPAEHFFVLLEGEISVAWKVGPTLVGAGLEMSALISLREILPKNAFSDALRWIALRLKIQTLLDDAEQSTGRIASLVEAVRSIARQERAEAADIDVHEQIKSALGILDHKLKNVRVAQNFTSEFGHVRGYPGELAGVGEPAR